MTPEQWEERISNWWAEHKSVLRYEFMKEGEGVKGGQAGGIGYHMPLWWDSCAVDWMIALSERMIVEFWEFVA